MSQNLSRELGLLMVPVLLIAGVAFWRSRVPDPVPKPLPIPPRRIASAPSAPQLGPLIWKRVALDAQEIGRHCSFAFEATPFFMPRSPLPPGVNSAGAAVHIFKKLGYRVQIGGKWRPFKPVFRRDYWDGYMMQAGGRSTLLSGASGFSYHVRLAMPLPDLPPGTQQVELSGAIRTTASYMGKWPATSTQPPGLVKTFGTGSEENLPVPPFKLLFKAPFPPPVKSELKRDSVQAMQGRFDALQKRLNQIRTRQGLQPLPNLKPFPTPKPAMRKSGPGPRILRHSGNSFSVVSGEKARPGR